MQQNNCNELHIHYNAGSGCTFVIALNTSYRNRGNGGTRMKNYSSVDEGIADALRSANAMTKKCIIIGDKDNGGYSGAKGVIIGDPITQKTPGMLRNYGRFVQSLNGRFQTGCDVNIYPSDLEYVAEETDFVDGLLSTGLGNGGAATAYGVVVAMKTLCEQKYGTDSLKDRVVAVQGVGSVGSDLVRRLKEEDADIVITDLDSAKLACIAQKYKVRTISPEDIYGTECEIFSPNACGDILTPENIGKLHGKLVIGAANNPLTNALQSAKEMQERGIIFAPDYVVNIGALVFSICEGEGKSFQYAINKIQEIVRKRLHQVVLDADKHGETWYEASEKIVHQELWRLLKEHQERSRKNYSEEKK